MVLKCSMLNVCIGAEEAFRERVLFDEAVKLLRAAAVGEASAGELEAELKRFKPENPAMPPTTAVLASIPASKEHPGAIYRLAGDRRALLNQQPGKSIHQSTKV